MLNPNSLLVQFRQKMVDRWDEVSEQERRDAEATLADYGRLLADRIKGEAVDEELAIVESTLTDVMWVGQSIANRLVRDIAAEAARLAGEFLIGAAEGLLK